MKNIILKLPKIVRWILSSFGLFNNILINDEEYMIRYEVAKHKYKLDKLADDNISIIRQIAYNNNYCGNNLLNESTYIKINLIEQGKFLDEFIGDSNYYIRKIVIKYCKNHPEKQECKKILLLNNI